MLMLQIIAKAKSKGLVVRAETEDNGWTVSCRDVEFLRKHGRKEFYFQTSAEFVAFVNKSAMYECAQPFSLFSVEKVENEVYDSGMFDEYEYQAPEKTERRMATDAEKEAYGKAGAYVRAQKVAEKAEREAAGLPEPEMTPRERSQAGMFPAKAPSVETQVSQKRAQTTAKMEAKAAAFAAFMMA